jgi:hypothetical protein
MCQATTICRYEYEDGYQYELDDEDQWEDEYESEYESEDEYDYDYDMVKYMFNKYNDMSTSMPRTYFGINKDSIIFYIIRKIHIILSSLKKVWDHRNNRSSGFYHWY